MDETNQDGSEVLETTETDAGAVETTEEDTVEGLKAKLDAERKAREETEAKNKQLYARVKKEETKTVEAPAPTPSLSIKDQVFLAKADIHEDDLDEVLDRARIKGISVQEAYSQVKPLLAARTEERKTAAATHVRGGARGASKPTGQDLLNKAEQSGDIPETDEGMTALAEARLARKKNRGS